MGKIRVARLGEAVCEIALVDGKNKVSDYFNAEMNSGDHEVRVNGQSVDANNLIKNEDVVTIVPNVRAGS